MSVSCEQEARDILERIGVENVDRFCSGDLVELANLIAANKRWSVDYFIEYTIDTIDFDKIYHDEENNVYKPVRYYEEDYGMALGFVCLNKTMEFIHMFYDTMKLKPYPDKITLWNKTGD